MKLPDKFRQNLILLLLAILIAYLLSFFVLPPQAATKVNLSDILVKGPSISEETNYLSMSIKWLLGLLAAFVAVKSYKYWQIIDSNKTSPAFKAPQKTSPSPDVKKYRETLSLISSLKTQSDPPKFIKRKRRRTIRKKSAHFSDKQTGKIINSSRSLSEFKAKQ